VNGNDFQKIVSKKQGVLEFNKWLLELMEKTKKVKTKTVTIKSVISELNKKESFSEFEKGFLLGSMYEHLKEQSTIKRINVNSKEEAEKLFKDIEDLISKENEPSGLSKMVS